MKCKYPIFCYSFFALAHKSYDVTNAHTHTQQTPPTRPVRSRPTVSFPSPPRSTRPTPTALTRTASATSSSTRTATAPTRRAARRSRSTTSKRRDATHKCTARLVLRFPATHEKPQVAETDESGQSCLLSQTGHISGLVFDRSKGTLEETGSSTVGHVYS